MAGRLGARIDPSVLDAVTGRTGTRSVVPLEGGLARWILVLGMVGVAVVSAALVRARQIEHRLAAEVRAELTQNDIVFDRVDADGRSITVYGVGATRREMARTLAHEIRGVRSATMMPGSVPPATRRGVEGVSAAPDPAAATFGETGTEDAGPGSTAGSGGASAGPSGGGSIAASGGAESAAGELDRHRSPDGDANHSVGRPTLAASLGSGWVVVRGSVATPEQRSRLTRLNLRRPIENRVMVNPARAASVLVERGDLVFLRVLSFLAAVIDEGQLLLHDRLLVVEADLDGDGAAGRIERRVEEIARGSVEVTFMDRAMS